MTGYSVEKYNPDHADQPRDDRGRWTIGGNEGDGGRGKFSHTEMLRTAVQAFGHGVHASWQKMPSEVRHALATIAAEHLLRQGANLLTGHNTVSSDRLARAMRTSTPAVSSERIARAVGAHDLQNHLRGAFGKSFVPARGRFGRSGVFSHLSDGAPRMPSIETQSGARLADQMIASRQFLTGQALSDYRKSLDQKRDEERDAFHQKHR